MAKKGAALIGFQYQWRIQTRGITLPDKGCSFIIFTIIKIRCPGNDIGKTITVDITGR